ncbi:hypothetical protein CLV67_11625 [Actinoplanes italicus]|uniref:Uncharacterized protein n=2 Tax=Actinoplanes italicus TaxID=113567 RepID=A0A2T0K326_9ACTN|nr:hypothetical protein CLV67_11625 [Actinoplanes italicus]
MPGALRRVMRELEQLSRTDLTVDLQHIEQALMELIARHARDMSDDQLREAVEDYIVNSMNEMRTGQRIRHRAAQDRFDRLEVMVRPYLEETGTLARDRHNRLSHMDAAVTHALDQLSDPETPIYDPRDPEPPREPRP